MASRQFYLFGDAVTTSRGVHIDPTGKLDDLKKAIASEFHVAQPSGTYLPFGTKPASSPGSNHHNNRYFLPLQ